MLECEAEQRSRSIALLLCILALQESVFALLIRGGNVQVSTVPLSPSIRLGGKSHVLCFLKIRSRDCGFRNCEWWTCGTALRSGCQRMLCLDLMVGGLMYPSPA